MRNCETCGIGLDGPPGEASDALHEIPCEVRHLRRLVKKWRPHMDGSGQRKLDGALAEAEADYSKIKAANPSWPWRD